MLDKDGIEQLLNIADKARMWPNLKSLHDDAMRTLEEHSRSLGSKPAEALRPPAEPPQPVVTEPVGLIRRQLDADNAERATERKERDDG